MLQGPPREPLRLGTLGGKAARTNHVRRPEAGEIYVGQCLEICDDDHSVGGHVMSQIFDATLLTFLFAHATAAGYFPVVDSDEEQ